MKQKLEKYVSKPFLQKSDIDSFLADGPLPLKTTLK